MSAPGNSRRAPVSGAGMTNFFNEAGVGIWPVTAFGLFTLYMAARYAWRAAPDRLALVLGSGTLTLLAGVLGSVKGFQSAVEGANGALSMIPIIAIGAREALNNLVLALIMVMVACIVATAGAWRAHRLVTASSSAAAQASSPAGA